MNRGGRPKHGMYKTREYKIWKGIIYRCFNPHSNRYSYYAERGITVCDRWRHDFAAFYADMGPRPSPEHTVDRIDNNKGYEPDNCRWATRSEQQRNTRQNVRLTKDGLTLTLIEWSERLGIKYDTLRFRIKAGKSVDDVLRVA